MKKIFLKLLKYCLARFQNEILNNIHNTTATIVTQLIINRTSLITDALLDSNPDDNGQIKEILKQTLVSEQFIALEQEGIQKLSELIKDPNLVKVLVGTEKLRLEILKVLADDDTNNGVQIENILGDYTNSEEFVEYVSLIAQFLLTKKLQ